MDKEALAEAAAAFSYLWNGEESGWVVTGSPEQPLIFNRKTSEALIVDDNDVYATLVARLKARNAEG
ncbi:hypothetical protein [Streptomyces sp. NPDC054866]